MLAQTSAQQVQINTGLSLIPILIGVVVGLAISALVCFLIYNAQNALPPQFQRIPAGQVWLLMIPLFNLVWNFFVFPRVADSYRDYFHSAGRPDVGDAGRGIGLGYAICAACSIIPCVGIFAGLAALVLLIIFLVKIYGLKAQIAAPAGGFPVQSNQTPPPQM
jgi:hypothetical protein